MTIAVKNAELPILSGNYELAKEVATAIKQIKSVLFVTMYGLSFKTIIHEGIPAPMPPPVNGSAKQHLIIREQEGYFEFLAPVFSLRERDEIAMYTDNVPAGHQKEVIGWVRVGLSKEVMKKTIGTLLRNHAIFAVLLMIVTGVVVTILLNIVLRPLNNLFTAVRNLREGEYPRLPPVKRQDEISRLCTEFNNLSQAIRNRELELIYSQKKNTGSVRTG